MSSCEFYKHGIVSEVVVSIYKVLAKILLKGVELDLFTDAKIIIYPIDDIKSSGF